MCRHEERRGEREQQNRVGLGGQRTDAGSTRRRQKTTKSATSLHYTSGTRSREWSVVVGDPTSKEVCALIRSYSSPDWETLHETPIDPSAPSRSEDRGGPPLTKGFEDRLQRWDETRRESQAKGGAWSSPHEVGLALRARIVGRKLRSFMWVIEFRHKKRRGCCWWWRGGMWSDEKPRRNETHLMRTEEGRFWTAERVKSWDLLDATKQRTTRVSDRAP